MLHYTDGATAELPIVFGEDTGDFANGGVPTRGEVAWSGGDAGTVRLFLRTYDNPRPEAEIATLDFISTRADAAPFLVALTLE